MRWLPFCLVFIVVPMSRGQGQDAASGRTETVAPAPAASSPAASSPVADSPPASSPAEISPELKAIQTQSGAFVDAFNRHDAEAVAALWTNDAEYVDDSGASHVGRDAIEQVYTQHFLDHPDTTIRVVIDSLRQVGDAVAIEDGHAIVSPAPPGVAGVSRYTAVHAKVGDQWRMASVRDSWVETTPSPDSAADLEFLIGEWVAEEHGVRMHSVCRWIADGHFVARTYTTTLVDGSEHAGLQLIGWNPTDEQMQSWMFSGDGGYAVGVWSLAPTGWVAETRGATGDGTLTTSLNRLSRLDDNAYVWQSTERTAGGVSLPDTDEVVIKRTPAKK